MFEFLYLCWSEVGSRLKPITLPTTIPQRQVNQSWFNKVQKFFSQRIWWVICNVHSDTYRPLDGHTDSPIGCASNIYIMVWAKIINCAIKIILIYIYHISSNMIYIVMRFYNFSTKLSQITNFFKFHLPVPKRGRG